MSKEIADRMTLKPWLQCQTNLKNGDILLYNHNIIFIPTKKPLDFILATVIQISLLFSQLSFIGIHTHACIQPGLSSCGWLIVVQGHQYVCHNLESGSGVTWRHSEFPRSLKWNLISMTYILRLVSSWLCTIWVCRILK